MPETQFPSVIQRMIDRQIGSGTRFFGSGPAAPGSSFRKRNRIVACSFNNQKAGVVKK